MVGKLSDSFSTCSIIGKPQNQSGGHRLCSAPSECHPGIVVGRLQHDKLIDPSWMNDLKQSFRFKEAADE